MEQKFRFPSREEYLKTLDKTMPQEYIQTREIGAGQVQQYLPLPIQEAIADDMFHYWNVTDEKYMLIANEVIATVRITYMPSYPDAEELYCTGSAAGPISMDSGAKVTDFPAKKKINALEYNLGSRRGAAVGCALNSLGNIFGRNIGRKINKNTPISSDFKIRKHE